MFSEILLYSILLILIVFVILSFSISTEMIQPVFVQVFFALVTVKRVKNCGTGMPFGTSPQLVEWPLCVYFFMGMLQGEGPKR